MTELMYSFVKDNFGKQPQEIGRNADAAFGRAGKTGGRTQTETGTWRHLPRIFVKILFV